MEKTSKKSAELISIGTELLLGNILNTNAKYISEKLSQMGIDVYYQTTVGDNPDRLERALELAKSRADIIITTGGLGPTYDDLSKETIARNFGRKLVMHEPSRARIEGFFKKIKREMTPNNLKQALMPEGSVIFENKMGTAPGCAVEDDNGKIAIMLPGPPREMTTMFENSVVDYLSQFCDSIIASKTIYTAGIGESTLEDRLYDMMTTSTNPTIAPYAKEGECILRVTAKCKTKEEAERLIDEAIEKVRERVGDYIYGVDVGTIENAIVKLLKEKGLRAAFAESCTGGLIAKRITDIPGASDVFGMGVVAYSNEAKMKLLGVDEAIIKEHGAVSEECAISMAKGIYEASGADFGLAVTGVAGPGQSEQKPAGLVYIALYDGTEVKTRKLNISYTVREMVRLITANYALDMLRRAAQMR
ncbi:MAG: competence/damage-inducible protein A [Clostridia bacterium]|nr:competence/damage-inducible protein A [Clostridia bacterium]